MPLPDELTAALACPACKQPLIYFPRGEADQREAEGFLLCPASQLRFPIDAAGIPVLLAGDAAPLEPAETARLVARARELGLAGA